MSTMTAQAARAATRGRARWPIFIGIAATVLILDQLAKAWLVSMLSPGERIQYAIGNLLVYGPLRNVLGMSRIRVAHVQSHGFLGTFAAHFHNGRATTGLNPRIRLSRRQLPWRLYGLTLQTLRNKPELEPVIRSCKPMIAALSTCHAVGEVVGILFGPGKSAERLR